MFTILAYWSQDKSNQCTKFPGSNTGFLSWSLFCKDSSNQRTNCAEYIEQANWRSNPAIVTDADYKPPGLSRMMIYAIVQHFFIQHTSKSLLAMNTNSQRYLRTSTNFRKLKSHITEEKI